MEIDNPEENNGNTAGIKQNDFILRPVSSNSSGEGLPYAPIDWPNPGDTWGWKVGKRIAMSGYHLDRYLYIPRRFQTATNKRRAFASKLSVKQFIQTAFPSADVDAFFASFSWKIPSYNLSLTKGDELGCPFSNVAPEEIAEHSASDSQSDTGRCKAGNKMCNSLIVEAGDTPLAAMPCDICCGEPVFCRDCCCILCCKTINSAHGGYSYIKCEAIVGEGYICGHVAHLDCALRSYMAGTVGGSIGLDVEYYCRRCDARTDLVSHVTRLIQTCESIESRDDIERILNVGVCILRGSQKATAKMLLSRIELALEKLKCGTCLEDIWKVKDDISAIPRDECCRENATLEVRNHLQPLDFTADSDQQIVSISSDHQIDSLKLEDEIYQVLQALRKSQDSEYKIAEERLNAQKNYLLNLYQQLEKERSELASRTSSADPDALLDAVLNRMDQIKREVMTLRDMEEVAKGFGKTSKGILKEHFGLEIDD